MFSVYCQGDKSISKLLCDIAQMDGWHDHHTISNLASEDIEILVSGHLPKNISDCKITFKDENLFLYKHLARDEKQNKWCKPYQTEQMTLENIKTLYSDLVSTRY